MIRHDWRPARVVSVEPAASDMVAVTVEPDRWIPHAAGQHFELRFPGEALSRKFSIASSPDESHAFVLGVQVLGYGLLSPRLAATQAGTRLEIRGPSGAAFAWRVEEGGPLILLGAGAGITPLVGMCDHYRAAGLDDPLIFIHTARSPERVFRLARYRDRMITRFTATDGRIDRGFLAAHLGPVLGNQRTRARVCGPSGFMTTMVSHLVDLGIQPDRIRSEAFV